MKKRALAFIIALCIAAAFMPIVSQAAVTPYFMAVNDTLLDFNETTMPFVSGSEIFIPVKVLEEFDIWSVGSAREERILVCRGVYRYLDFITKPGETKTTDQDGNTLDWPAARRVGDRFYVPLNQVCAFFGLRSEIYDIKREIIPDEQMRMIRIISGSSINTPTFEGLNRNALRAAYNKYQASIAPQTPPPGATNPPPPVEPTPDYSGVTIHLSFYDISSGSAGGVLDFLDTQAAFGYQCCFFVSAADIADNPDVIRRIAGSGHSIGIKLTECSYEEYLETSALLFEAAKIKTLLVSACGKDPADYNAANAYGLVFWENSNDADYYDTVTVDTITASIPDNRGARLNLMFSCSEDAALLLTGVISFLRVNEFMIVRITETVLPV